MEQIQTLTVLNACDGVGSGNSVIEDDQGVPRQRAIYLRFDFTLPHHLFSIQGDMADEFLKFCPSTKLGMSYRAPFEETVYGQPNITYAVRVLRLRRSAMSNLSQPYEFYNTVTREVLVRPAPKVAPPVQITDFPNEYSVQDSVILRRRFYHRNGVGVLSVTSDEPAPMESNVERGRSGNESSVLRPSTTINLKLLFTPFSNDFLRPPCWTWSITQAIRSRTFFSANLMDRAPTCQAAKEQNSLMRFTDHISQLKTFEYRLEATEWISADSKDTDAYCWSARLSIGISSAQTSLLPTFLNQLSARRYAILLRIKVKEMFSCPLQLVLPLQVIGRKLDCRNRAHEDDASGVGDTSLFLDDTSDEGAWDVTPPAGGLGLPLYESVA